MVNSSEIDIVGQEKEGKVCSKCGVWKVWGEFGRDRSSKDGYQFWCKQCVREHLKSLNYPRQETGVKTCTGCGLEQDVSEFSSDKANRDGLNSRCKTCVNNYSKTRNFERSVEGTKICTKCRIEKPVGNFRHNKRSKDGLSSWCKDCQNAYDRAKNFPRQTEGTKFCNQCQRDLLVECFGSNKKSSDGLYYMCKECVKKKHQENSKKSVVQYDGTKVCGVCKEEFNITEFNIRRSNPDGRDYLCKKCSREKGKEQVKKHKEKIKKYQAEYYEENKNGKIADWKEANKDKINENKRRKHRERVVKDIQYKLKLRLRQRLNIALKRGFKGGSAIRDLGCSITILKFFLENQFYAHPKTGGMMTWDNWGKGKNKWQIDHIIPLDSFDLSSPEQVKKACHVSNLQPLWWDENARKYNKMPDEWKRGL